MIRKLSFLFIFLFFFTPLLYSQQPADTSQPVEILYPSKNLRFLKVNANTELKIISGGVKLKQGNVIFTCDSCVINDNANLFEAFGNVHIDDDTTQVYSNYLRYLTNTKMAYLTGKVKLTDGQATLTTNNLEYDVTNKIGIYKNGGRVVNKKSVLTSKEGIYYTDLRDIYFKKNVELKDPAYYLKTDSLLYNTATQIARFIAETFIRDSSKTTITTREGFYDVANRRAEFTSRTEVRDDKMFASGDEMISDDEKGIVQLRGRAVMIDTSQGISILAGEIFINKKTDAFLATIKPLMIIKQDEDSIYITADTLFSARLTDLYSNKNSLPQDSLQKDTLKGITVATVNKDSTNRYFEAFRNVRVFSDSVQTVSDSLFYSFKDSVFQLYYDPVVWNNKNQITGDTIFLFTKNKKADRIKVIENSFLISQVEPGVYNQIKSSRMDGFFKEGRIDSVRANGFAESVYFLQDDDSSYTSANQTASDAIDIYFDKGELYKVVLRSAVKGTLWPISQKTPAELELKNFKWLESRRPKTKYDLFE